MNTLVLFVGLVLAQVSPAEVRFSPRGGAAALVCQVIAGAETEILLGAYQFTNPQIIRAVMAAHQRGVRIRMILDRSQETARASGLAEVRRARVPVRLDRAHRIYHNKTLVVDGRTIVTGSLNFSTSADCLNAENVLVLHDPRVARQFTDDFERHWRHAQP